MTTPSKPPAATAWEAELNDALGAANIPTLLMVLVHLTGDMRWLSPRFQCTHVQGLDDNDSGGLPESVQAEVVDAARDALLQWKRGKPPALAAAGQDLLATMMRFSIGEDLPPDYGAIIAAGLGLDPDFALDQREAFNVPAGFRVIVIGAGVAGLCAAIRLQAAGVPYLVVEKNAEVGGTWYENRYPGAGVDTPSHIYSYSFAKHDWTQHFALQHEIQGYFEGVADAYGVRPNLRLNTRVESARYDEATMRWTVAVVDAQGCAESLEANVLIGAVGYLNTPKLPAIKGLETFDGPCFHTARWPQDLDLGGKRVAVIGNGASAMQVAPAIADSVHSLTLFQRSRQWAAPFARFRQPIVAGARFLLREVPYYQEWYRQRLAWIFNDRIHATLQIDPAWPYPERAINARNDRHRAYFSDYIVAELGDRQDLLPEVLPDYPPFGKRMLMDNGWFRTVAREHVRLVSDGIAEVAGNEIVTRSGERHRADILVIATGFDAANMLASFKLHGKGGRSIREAWDATGAEAYMGMTVPGFPNLFVLSGPNTGLGHGGSVVALLESQVRYVMGVIQQALARCSAGFEIEVRPEVHAAFNASVQAAHKRMIWSHKGMSNWYRNAAGRVVVTTPFRNDVNWHMARRTDLNDFVLRPADPTPTRR
jgi:4-hydroxyacetophenone monooxygenase